MTGVHQLPAVSPTECLCRFITVPKWVRDDKTIRSNAFIPPRDLNLSVTRRLQLTEEQLWKLGQRVADQVTGNSPAAFPGRADILAANVFAVNLRVEAVPLTDNPNHAHISGWPEKPARKNIAQQLAAAARFIEIPENA
jgi:hypothetical protein